MRVMIGDLIYPRELFAGDIITAYKILEELKAEGFLSTVYEVYCYNCNKPKGLILNSISEFNDDLHCDFCKRALNIADDLIVLYIVVS